MVKKNSKGINKKALSQHPMFNDPEVAKFAATQRLDSEQLLALNHAPTKRRRRNKKHPKQTTIFDLIGGGGRND